MKTFKILLRTTLTLLLVVSIALPAGAVKYTYDDLDRLVEVEYESGQRLTYTYDAGGNIVNIEVYIPLKLEPIGEEWGLAPLNNYYIPLSPWGEG